MPLLFGPRLNACFARHGLPLSVIKSTRDFLELIKFEHTVFALPFAYLGMILAAQGLPTWFHFAWITIAMVAARTLAMGANRLADRDLDARNPRTAERPLVVGTISSRTVWSGLGISAIVLGLAAFMLGPLPFRLLPGALLFVVGYPFAKRFTSLSHLVLGFTDGLAPMGAWAAIRGSLFTASDLPAWLLLGVVTFWIGGFDLIYACQDVEVDRRERLHAVPAIYGIPAALRLSAAFHVLTGVLLLALGWSLQLGVAYWIGVAVTLGLLAYEHVLVTPDDLSRLDFAFFNLNSVISITLFVGALIAQLMSTMRP
jgi:4-hydroxybenzoate polyprenyltransferase